MRVSRAWSSREFLDRLSKVRAVPGTGALRGATRRSHPHKVLSSFEPISEFDPGAASTPQEVTSSTTGSTNVVGGRTGSDSADNRTVGDVLRQTVDFLVYEVEPVLVAEHLRRSRRNSPSKVARGMAADTSPLLMSTEQLRRLLTDIITDTESDEFATFCRLLRKLDTDRHTAEFLEALDLVLKVVGGCTCRYCLERGKRDINCRKAGGRESVQDHIRWSSKHT